MRTSRSTSFAAATSRPSSSSTRPGQEPGYTLEVFNAETHAVVTVRESQIEPLRDNEVLHVRRLEEAVA